MRVTIKQRSRAEVRLKSVTYSSAAKATGEQAEAGSNDQLYMTPLTTKQSIGGNAELANFTPPGTGAVVRPVRTKLREVLSPEDFGAVGDGTTDDTAAFTAAMAGPRLVRSTPGKTYVLGDYAPDTNASLDLTGCRVRRKPGAKRILDLGAYHGTVIGGDFIGQGVWTSTTTSASASPGATTISVTSAAGLQVGMRCAYASNWRDGRELNEVTGVSGTTITLAIPLRGNVASGAPFLADFPLIRMSGSSFISGSLRDVWVRDCLFGVQKGETGITAGNSFGSIHNLRVSEFIGAGLLLFGNNAGEAFTDFVLNGGRTQTASYTATASQTRFAYPWMLTKTPSRWGSNRTIRVTVNGAAVADANYSVDTGTGEVVLSSGATAGDTVVVSNYEFAAAGLWANSANRTGGSALERLTSGIVIAAGIGNLIESSELGFFGNVVADTCSYAGTLVKGSTDMQFAGCSFLYAPFPLIIDSTCARINVAGCKTSLMPDSDELTPTPNKKDIRVESGATNVNIDYLSWQSTTHLYDVPVSTMASTRRATLSPHGLAVGVGPSANLLDIKTSGGTNGLSLSSDGQTINFGNTGFNYIQNNVTNATLRVGAVGASGKTEISCGSGVALTANSDTTVTVAGNRIAISGDSGPIIRAGSAAPEGLVTAPVGSIFLRTGGGAGTSFYVKESGTGNTGWVAK